MCSSEAFIWKKKNPRCFRSPGQSRDIIKFNVHAREKQASAVRLEGELGSLGQTWRFRGERVPTTLNRSSNPLRDAMMSLYVCSSADQCFPGKLPHGYLVQFRIDSPCVINGISNGFRNVLHTFSFGRKTVFIRNY